MVRWSEPKQPNHRPQMTLIRFVRTFARAIYSQRTIAPRKQNTVPNALQNPILTDARFSAAFANNGPTGAIHIPLGWSYLYEAGGTTHVVERRNNDEQPQWITERPPQAQRANPYETGTYLETTSYTGVGGFRQRVTLTAQQRYVARALFTLFAVADAPPDDSVRVQTRITHADGIVTSAWQHISADHLRRPTEALTPVIQSSTEGDVVFDFVADIRYPLIAVKLVIHELALNTVGQNYGTVTRVVPLGTIPPPPATPPPVTTPTPLPPAPTLPMPPVGEPERRGCRPSLRALALPRRQKPTPPPPSNADDWPL